MRCPIRLCFVASVAIGFLWLLVTLKAPWEIEADRNMKATKGHVATPALSVGTEDNHSRRNDLRPLEEWQDLHFKYMDTVHQRRKTWLTVGISSVPGPNRNSLSHTLVSLFRASSKAKRRQLTVVVHLADSNLTWLRETVVQMAHLFSPQILAGQLILIHAPADAYPALGDVRDEAYQGEVYSKQNVDHAFLLSFAAKRSHYFLLLEDDVFCAPSFMSHIRQKVNAMSSDAWVLLEFSNMGFLGKLFRSKDLPVLAHFLLLFYKEKPLHRLIPHFRTLMAQKDPVLCRPFLFYHRMVYYSAQGSRTGQAVRSKAPSSPDNPPGAVFTDMKVFSVHFPWEAYTLDASFFWTHSVRAGSHLTVILNHPANLSRVQVLTGTIMDGKYTLERGHVELGYEPEGVPQSCTSFTVLGRLLEGQMDQEIFLRRMRCQVSCVKLVVDADQPGGLIVRHISLWEEHTKAESSADRSARDGK
nr:hypothetical protein HJG59_012199 [Molossus molossus]